MGFDFVVFSLPPPRYHPPLSPAGHSAPWDSFVVLFKSLTSHLQFTTIQVSSTCTVTFTDPSSEPGIVRDTSFVQRIYVTM